MTCSPRSTCEVEATSVSSLTEAPSAYRDYYVNQGSARDYPPELSLCGLGRRPTGSHRCPLRLAAPATAEPRQLGAPRHPDVPAHGRARRDDREHRTPGHPHRPALLRREPVLGGERLRVDVRRLTA